MKLADIKITPEKRLFAGFSILFAVTLLIYVAAYLTVENLVLVERHVTNTYRYRSGVQKIFSLLKDAETGARGFVLSGKAAYLTPYNDAFDEIPPAVQQLRQIASGDPARFSSAQEIEGFTDLELRQLKALIELKANGASQNEIDESLENQRTTMDQLRHLVAPIDQSTLTILRDYLKQAEAQNMFAQSLLPTLGISVLALFLVVFRQVHAQLQAQKMLQKSEQELTIARDKALDASRLKSEFVANISHEIRTPLGGILGMAELLTLKSLESESFEISNHLFESAKHLLTVVNDLLDFSKLEAGAVELESIEFSVRDTVNEAVRAVNAEADKKGLLIAHKVSNAVPDSLEGDATRIKQVLLNLLHNAIKFTKAGLVTIDVDSDGVAVKFSVTDTGIGVAPSIQQNLFQPFVQADGSTTRVYGGTGLGLSISKNLVQLMKGEIGVTSVEGSGSTFWFSIPLVVSEAQADERAKISQSL